jgi:hypothetical protein
MKNQKHKLFVVLASCLTFLVSCQQLFPENPPSESELKGANCSIGWGFQFSSVVYGKSYLSTGGLGDPPKDTRIFPAKVTFTCPGNDCGVVGGPTWTREFEVFKDSFGAIKCREN